MRGIPYTLLLCVVAGCSLNPQVIAKFDAEAKTLIVTGCKAQPEIRVLVDSVSALYPASGAAVVIADNVAEAFCKKALSLQVKP